jgi:signal transduction histidine kinase
MTPHLSTGRVLAASAVAAAGLVIVGWLDYSATRQELLRLLRDQAGSLRQTIAAAARSNEAAGDQAETQVTERLLDNARLLGELDRRVGLTQELLDDVASRNRLFRIAVFAADGSRELSSGGGAGGGSGQGRGFPGAPLIERLIGGTETEFVEKLHSPRWGGGARVAAGVRRARGGGILLNADASEIEALQQQISLDRLVRDIGASTPQIAYVAFERGDVRVAYGDLPSPSPQDEPAGAAPARNSAQPVAERQLTIGGRPILDFSGPVSLGSDVSGTLRLGLRLDDLQRAEQRFLLRLVTSLAAALIFSLLALGTLWLRQAYGTLSEKHALAEAALRRRDRLSAMGELASTVAHEVRNPLNAVAMSAQRLRLEFPSATSQASEADTAELRQLIGVIEGETRRINDIVQQFLEFARPPKLAPREIALGTYLSDIVTSLQPLASSRGVALEAEVTGAGDAVLDPDQLRQAIDNLVRNAIEATPQAGRVHVRAQSVAKGHSIEVRDTGAVIEPEVLPRIFDLYFTTKPHGTGVGLAVTHQIVTAHGGTIEVESKPGAGTSMTIRLPRTIGEATSV